MQGWCRKTLLCRFAQILDSGTAILGAFKQEHPRLSIQSGCCWQCRGLRTTRRDLKSTSVGAARSCSRMLKGESVWNLAGGEIYEERKGVEEVCEGVARKASLPSSPDGATLAYWPHIVD